MQSTHSRHTRSPQAHEIEAQEDWEVDCIEEGARRVREVMLGTNISDSVLGHKLIRMSIGPLVKVIKDDIETEADNMAQAHDTAPGGPAGIKHPPKWLRNVCLLEPEKMALITLKNVFHIPPGRMKTYSVSSIAKNIGQDLRIQLQFDKWSSEERSKPRPENKLELLKSQTKQINKRAWTRFRTRALESIDREWTQAECLQVGVKGVDWLVEAMPSSFSVEVKPIGRGRTSTQLVVSDEFIDRIVDIMEKTELMAPRKLPMICPPQPWRLANDQEL